MISKVLHFSFYWEAMPTWAEQNIAEWERLNPDYRIEVWRQPPYMPSEIEEALEWAPTYRFRGDLVRYWVLLNNGGIHVDIDTRPITAIPDEILDHSAFLTAYGLNHEQADNFFMGCTPDHPIMHQAIQNCLHPETWPVPDTWFGTLNAFPQEQPGKLSHDATLLPFWTSRMPMFKCEMDELKTREEVFPFVEVFKHYCYHGVNDLHYMDQKEFEQNEQLMKVKRVKYLKRHYERWMQWGAPITEEMIDELSNLT